MHRGRKIHCLKYGLLILTATIAYGKSLDPTKGCSEGFQERQIYLHDQGLIETRCCHPISSCEPDHHVVDCLTNNGEDQCLPCAEGLVQPNPSNSYSRFPCVYPISCAEEAVPRKFAGEWKCQCDVKRGYCGQPSDCRKATVSCGPDSYLHPESCKCIATGMVKPSTESSRSQITTTPYSAPPSTDDHSDVKETKAKIPSPVSAVTPSKIGDEVTIRTTTTSSSPTNTGNFDWTLGLILGFGLLLLLAVIIFVLIRRSRQSSNIQQWFTTVYNKFTSVVNINPPTGSTRDHDDDNSASPPAPENENTEPKSARLVCQEEAGGQQEVEGPGDHPHKPLLPPPAECIALHSNV